MNPMKSAQHTPAQPRQLSIRRQRQLMPRPGKGQVRLNLGAVGLSPLGVQAVGTVDAVGQEAVGFAPGDRVALRLPGTRPGFPRIASERDLIGIPKDVSFDEAAGLLPAGLIARTIVKQLHSIGRGNRVRIETDDDGAHRFVAAWVEYVGATVVTDDSIEKSDVVVTAEDFRTARRWRFGHGLGQLAAADVFAAIRAGAFAGLDVSIHPLGEASRLQNDIQEKRTAGPVVLMPGDVSLAA
ncbi:MAG: NADPH:quinone reductase [Actinomycetota bacterium]|nr:NADPH:quinone reductase [Actinomycetota bacterium]